VGAEEITDAATGLPPLLASLRDVLQQPAEARHTPRSAGRRQAAVLVPFFNRGDEMRVLVFRRTDRVPTHKGQVAFPGGAEDPGDRDLLDTALREANEEVGIERDDVVVLGPLPAFDTRVSDFVVSPFCGYLPRRDPEFVPQDFEVDEVLEIPLDELRSPQNRHWGLVPGFSIPIPLPYYRVGDTIIWGASGGIVDNLLEALDEAEARIGA
jgi:8-oxo-dGTP pyrophosphatase MutT (NUDIX family)